MSTAPAAAPRTLRLRGLEAAVEVRFDGVGVPHIRARSLRDLYFAQGFVTASRRLWQLDITRRTARGRLAEVFGPRAVSGDRFQRSLGLVRLAAAKTAALAPDVAGRLRAYADGVNAFIAQGELPEAFHLTGGGAAPRPWTVEDTLCAVELRSIINASWRADLVQLQVLARVGAREAASFFPPGAHGGRAAGAAQPLAGGHRPVRAARRAAPRRGGRAGPAGARRHRHRLEHLGGERGALGDGGRRCSRTTCTWATSRRTPTSWST